MVTFAIQAVGGYGTVGRLVQEKNLYLTAEDITTRLHNEYVRGL